MSVPVNQRSHGKLEAAVKARAYLADLRFELNEEKTRIYPLREGIEFLGFNFRLTDTGKVLMLIRPDKVKAVRRRLRRLVRKSLRGEIPPEKVWESYCAWRNHASKGNAYQLLRKMDKYYHDLWRDEHETP